MLENEVLVEAARSIVRYAKEKGITLRILGAIAFRIHCQRFLYLSERMHRNLTDIDLIGYQKDREKIVALLKQLSYTFDASLDLDLSLCNRLVFWKKDLPEIHVDVFLDRLNMCHVIDFKNRLEVESETIPLAEMLLEKMQIVNPAEKDFIDTILLLREHSVGNVDFETINITRIADTLSRDWGFYYTVTKNLKELLMYLPTYDALNSDDRRDVDRKISLMLETISKWPKKLGWKMRAMIGTGSKWYQDVEEIKP